MRPVLALGTVIALLVFFIVYVFVGNAALHVTAWIVVIGVATFFAAGGGNEGFAKGLVSNLAGFFWAAIALEIWNATGGGHPTVIALSILLAIAAFVLCLESSVPALSYVPGAFLGAGTWVGAVVGGAGGDGGNFQVGDLMLAISIVVGAVLGYVSQKAIVKLTQSGPREQPANA